MKSMDKWCIGFILVTYLIYCHAASPMFIQAITSSLATIPLSGGPVTTGLVGAKLGIGTKLLYYLGYFGRKTPSKKAPKATSKGSGFSSQKLPQSGMFSNGFSTSPVQASYSGIDPSQLFQALTAQGVDPNVVVEALNYAGSMNEAPNVYTNGAFAGFGQNAMNVPGGFVSNAGFGGFGPTGGMNAQNAGFGSSGPVGMNTPSSGFVPNAGLVGFNAGGMNVPNNGFASNTAFGGMNIPNSFSSNAAFGGFGSSGQAGGMNAPNGFLSNAAFGGFDQSESAVAGEQNSGVSGTIPAQHLNPLREDSSSNQPVASENSTPDGEPEDDAESFFTFLQDMDENTCISRLICDIGHSPSFLGEFSENISSMVSTLKVPQTSRAYKYIEIMENGKMEGQCEEKFPECGNMSYEVVKNVAPSVSLPQNVNPANLNF